MAQTKPTSSRHRSQRTFSVALGSILLASVSLGVSQSVAQTITNEGATQGGSLRRAANEAGAPFDLTDPNADGTATVGPAQSVTASEAELRADRDEAAGFGRQNLPEENLTGAARAEADAATGLRLGTFTLNSALNQRIVHEREKLESGTTERTFSETGLNLSMISDWSRHQLTMNAAGTYQYRLSGNQPDDYTADLNAELRLDLLSETTLTLTGGYSYGRQQTTDATAVSNAVVQSAVNTFSGSAILARQSAGLRTTLELNAQRQTFGDATLADGSKTTSSDRDATSYGGRARLGYQISPTLVPFLQASANHIEYDNATDSEGFARSAWTFGGRAGVEFDTGEKLTGEIGIGYDFQTNADDRLVDIGAIAVDAAAQWSPLRGTTVDFAASTLIEPTTTAGDSGSVSYLGGIDISKEIGSRLTARLGGDIQFRDSRGSADTPDQLIYGGNAGLTFALNRFIDIDADATYQQTKPKSGATTDIATFSIGMTLRR